MPTKIELSLGCIILALFVVIYTCCLSSKDNKDDTSEKEAFNSYAYADYQDKAYLKGVNDELNHIDTEDVDWQEGIQALGLEDSIFESQKEFVDDSAKTTTGSSAWSTRSYDQDVNDWVGLRRPDYNITVGSTARVVPSEYGDQMPRKTRFLV